MNLRELTGILKFWRHLEYHRDILKHVRWNTADEKRINFYNGFLSAGNLVFDVGANMGNRSKIFRAIGAKVIAFEPQSYCATFLEIAFTGDKDFTLIKSALSNQEGQQTMHISDTHVLSTLDNSWIDLTHNSGRFPDQKWDKSELVQVTTLDKCIEIFGLPDFVKIDVEGYEYNVISGLTHAVKHLSLEFASESLESIFQCIDHLGTLDQYEYRLSLGESMEFEGDSWAEPKVTKDKMLSMREQDPLVWGDIYARRIH